jgi:hypothetical protein
MSVYLRYGVSTSSEFRVHAGEQEVTGLHSEELHDFHHVPYIVTVNKPKKEDASL